MKKIGWGVTSDPPGTLRVNMMFWVLLWNTLIFRTYSPPPPEETQNIHPCHRFSSKIWSETCWLLLFYFFKGNNEEKNEENIVAGSLRWICRLNVTFVWDKNLTKLKKEPHIYLLRGFQNAQEIENRSNGLKNTEGGSLVTPTPVFIVLKKARSFKG